MRFTTRKEAAMATPESPTGQEARPQALRPHVDLLGREERLPNFGTKGSEIGGRS